MTSGSETSGSDRHTLATQLKALGLMEGDIVIVHASMRRVAPRSGETSTVIQALVDVLGPDGTLVVPAQTGWNSTTSPAHRAAVASLTAQEALAYRMALPGFDPLTTPSSGMGALAEGVRTLPGAHRSAHPQTSFAAVGRHAKAMTAVHDLDCHLGPRSPMGALYEADALVLLLGVGFSVCTAFHLAEYRYERRPRRRYMCKIAGIPGEGWVDFNAIDLDDSDFGELGERFEQSTGCVHAGRVGNAESRLFKVRAAVDFAECWIRRPTT